MAHGRPLRPRTRRTRPARPSRAGHRRPVRRGVRRRVRHRVRHRPRRARRLRRHRPQRLAAAERFGANPVDATLPDPKADPYPVTVSTSASPASLAATLKATWPYGVCTDTWIYYGDTFDLPIFDLYGTGIRFVTGRANARADIPHVLGLLATGPDLRPAVETVADWESAPRTWAALRAKTVLTRA
ncbi:hypothetical protein FAGKG844_590023 [Frankia sp. AgKG'84/4]